MRHCNKCNTDKPIDQFAIKNKATGKHNTVCKPCIVSSNRQHYLRNKIKYSQASVKWNKKQYHLLRKILRNIKTFLGCLVCKEQEPIALDFHHLFDHTKEYNLSNDINKYRTLNLMVEELEKCVVICSNCHRKYHGNIQNIVEIVHKYRDNNQNVVKDLEMVLIEIRSAEGGEDSKLLVKMLADAYQRRATALG